MEKFTILKSIAAPLPLINIDTDMLIPKQFLKTIKRTGLGKNLFFEMRYDLQGNEIAGFILNQPDFKNAKILIAGENFGCGSSREHAPWALLDFGIHCIIAPSFADIFYNNCFKNGILPVTLDARIVDKLFSYAKDKKHFIVDLEKCQVQLEDGKSFQFQIDQFRRYCLLNGLDDIGLTLQKKDKINQFEIKNKQSLPWLYN